MASGLSMKRFVAGEDRRQGVLLPEFLDDYVSEENPVRAIDVFVDELDLGALGFEGVVPEATGRPSYHPGVLLKIYVYGYINQVASSRRLERASRNSYGATSSSVPPVVEPFRYTAPRQVVFRAD